MRLDIEWSTPVPLRSGERDGLIYTIDLDRLEPVAGVYVFARRWGSRFEALYVGKANNIRLRIRSHLNNLRLMRHLQDARSGKRVVIAGYAMTRPGQQIPKVLPVLERSLIRHFLSEGHDLVNKSGVRIRRHEITSSRTPRGLVPSPIFLERGSGR